jgi:predicted alpha/beta superfamily hydrolase
VKNLKWPFLILLILFSVNTAYSQGPKFELLKTEVITFNSVLDSQKFVLNILLPVDYAETKKKYPVLYVTDGQWCFNSAVVAYGDQNYDGLVPDLIIVGITWTDNYWTRRLRDLTPTPAHLDWAPNSGNASKFLAVIKNEIIKLIESKYRIEKSDKALYGISAGGTFAIYTLFHVPTLFNR